MMLKIKYSYISSQVLRAQNVQRFEDEAKQAHLKGEQWKHQVFCQLNHPHKHNILTPQMIKQIHRFLESYDLDETIRVIWLDCASKGTDFKYFNYLQKPERIEYLRQIQNLATYFGQYDKILMPVIKGEVSGSMASMVCTTPFQFFEGQSGIRFNDVNKGFIPHAGATFHLSRLPDYLGFYYALTGRWIKRDDAVDLNLVYAKLTSREEATSYLGEMLSEYPEVNTQNQYPYEMATSVEDYEEGYSQFLEKLSEEMIERMKTEDAQLVAQECFYKLKRFQQENAKVNQIQARISNPYLYFKEWMVDGMENNGFISRVKIPKQNRALIARCFSAENVDQIKERLRAEQSEEADSILTELEAQPKLSLDLTFKLLKQAENLQWRDCLVAEYNVAANFVTSTLFEKQERVQNIDSFFNSVSPKIDYLPNALEPVKDYYQGYPNNIRYFLNEKNLRKGLKDRANQEIDVSAFMISNLHPTDGSVRVSDLRKMRLEVDDMKRELKLKLQKLKSIIGYEENLKLYIQERLNYLNSIKDFKPVFEDALKKFFDKANQSRLDAYKNVAQIAVVKQKRELFSLVRNSLLNNKLTQDADDNFDVEKYQKWVRGMNRLLIFPKSDSQSYYENQLPEKIVDKENNYYPFQTKAIRRKFFETRYGDQDYDVQQQLEKYYRTVIERITKSNKFNNILEYLEGKEVKEILQQLKDDKKQFVVELDPVKQDKNHNKIIQAYQKEFQNLKTQNIQGIQNDLTHLFEQNEFLDGIMKIFYQCPDQFKPLQNQFEAMLNKAYELRAKKIQPFQNLGAIDEEINQSLILDSFKLIESNLMFSFSYALISDLEEIYNVLKSSGNVDVQIAKIKQLYKVDLEDEELYCEFIYYLNDKLQVATTLYNTYRQKCLLQSDKLLDYLVTLRADRDINFTSKAIYRNRLHLQMNDTYTNLVDCWDGKFVEQSNLDDLYESIESADKDDLLDDDIFDDDLIESEYQQIDERFEVATAQEFEIFSNLKKLKRSTKKQKELIVGLHYYLQRMDLINERQVDITPDFIKNQKLELDTYLRKKYYQFQPLQQWFEELTQETISQIYRPNKILTEEQFRKSLYNGFQAEKRLLEELRSQLILQEENQSDDFIQSQKLNEDAPQIDNLIQQLAIAETLKKEGFADDIEPFEIFSQTKPSIKKYGEEETQKPTRRPKDLQSQLMEENKKSEVIEQILSKEIDTLFDRIQNLKSQ